MDKQTRLALLKSRASSLKSVVSDSINTFRPIPSARHSLGLGGGVVFKANPIAEKEEGLAADFAAAPIPEIQSDLIALDKESASFIEAWTKFELTALSESSKLLLMA